MESTLLGNSRGGVKIHRITRRRKMAEFQKVRDNSEGFLP
jgi:hypothetical protein